MVDQKVESHVKWQKAIILSHSSVGENGFETVLLNLGKRGEKPSFLRPYTQYNTHPHYGMWGLSKEEMLQKWVPGRSIWIDCTFYRFTSGIGDHTLYANASVPECAYIPQVRFCDEFLIPQELRTLLYEYAQKNALTVHTSLSNLYPNVLRFDREGRPYRSREGWAPASIGYVYARSVKRISTDYIEVLDLQVPDHKHLYQKTEDNYIRSIWKGKLASLHLVRDQIHGRRFQVGREIYSRKTMLMVGLSLATYSEGGDYPIVVTDILW